MIVMQTPADCHVIALTSPCRALGDETEEEDDLEMGEGDDDADVATDAAAPTVDPLQAQKDRDKQDKKLLEDRYFITEI